MTTRIEILEDPDRLAQAAAERFVRAAQQAVEAHGVFRVALSGGSTPRRAYARLAEASGVDWAAVHVFWGDERCVPPDDARSNYRLARQSLLDHVSIPSANIHRMPGELEPEAGARAYEAALQQAFIGRDEPSEAPRFDLILLGLGADGHTASLFPGSSALTEQARWVAAATAPGDGLRRLTLTLPVLNAAAEVVFLVSGGDKADIVRRVLRGPHNPQALPAQSVGPTQGVLTWLLGTSAAARL